MKRVVMCLLMLAVAMSGCSYQNGQNENDSQVKQASESSDFKVSDRE